MPDYQNVIAVLDDDEIFLLLIKKMIQKSNITDTILQFSNPHEGLFYFRNNANNPLQLPSIILLDLYMGNITGWQFLKQLENIQFPDNYDPSVFIISGAENIDFEKLRNYPLIKGYLTKPIIPDKLISLIESTRLASRLDQH